MVNQSDLPFRLLVERYGATATYTQMLIPDKLLHDRDYLEFHLRDFQTFGLTSSRRAPVVIQLCGNDPDTVVQAGKKVQGYCDAIDLNLGCPQEAARDGHFGAYLLGQRDWPLVEGVVSAMSSSLNVPISAKLRLCQPVDKTKELALRLEAQGAAWITLHARTVSARRRRQGPADLRVVRELKSHLNVPVISNGNVRSFPDLQANLEYTAADGLMVGETLLDNPWSCRLSDFISLFVNVVPDPLEISLEYLELCEQYPETATLPTIQAHVRHFVESQCNRQPWFPTFREALKGTENVTAIQNQVRRQTRATGKEREENGNVTAIERGGSVVVFKGSSLLDDDDGDEGLGLDLLG
ncbi:t-diRNAhydrouridine synthase [Coprinopsis sp. MPI-PUGE-AT-0042]|nr:t-diRNAhydrouridine synthase [Coprinopsis sp. MPI-PUGE-AT-0042]